MSNTLENIQSYLDSEVRRLFDEVCYLQGWVEQSLGGDDLTEQKDTFAKIMKLTRQQAEVYRMKDSFSDFGSVELIKTYCEITMENLSSSSDPKGDMHRAKYALTVYNMIMEA